MRFDRLPKWLLRLIKLPPQIAYRLGLGSLMGRLVLLLTTTGRKTGLPRVTPLQYEPLDDAIGITSARGIDADWYRNIVADPRVLVRVRDRCFEANAEVTTDPARVAAFLDLRLKRHPRMVGAMLRAEGLSSHPTFDQLEHYAAGRALVVLHPSDGELRSSS